MSQFNPDARKDQLRQLNTAELQEMIHWFDEPQQKDDKHMQLERKMCHDIINERKVDVHKLLLDVLNG